MKIHKGDIVKIISGNDKGKKGKVLAVLPQEGKIVVEGINVKKKHVKPRQQGKKGELVKTPLPFPAPRAMLLCSKCGKPTRVRMRTNDARQKIRICQKCGGEI